MLKMYWKKILLAGITMELLYFPYVFLILGSAAAANTTPGLVGVFMFIFIGGLGCCWSIASDKTTNILLVTTINGALVGVVAVLLFFLIRTGGAIASGGEIEITFGLNHFLKIMGGTAGGFMAGARTFYGKSG